MQTVYIWENDYRTGHASLGLDYGYPNYLSFHPRGSPGHDPFSNTRFALSSYKPEPTDFESDMEKFGRWADRVQLRSLDNIAMSEFIAELLDPDMHHEYQVVFQNCSTTVGVCLMKGFARIAHERGWAEELRFNYEGSNWARALSHYGPHAHSPLSTLLFEDLERSFLGGSRPAYGMRNPVQNIALGIAGVLAGLRHVLWTPDDVLRFAHYIQSVENGDDC